MSAELEHIWSRVQAELAQAVEESTYRIWLQPLRPRELSERCLQIEAPADACRWICEPAGSHPHLSRKHRGRGTDSRLGRYREERFSVATGRSCRRRW